jgi:hypothetical protein
MANPGAGLRAVLGRTQGHVFRLPRLDEALRLGLVSGMTASAHTALNLTGSEHARVGLGGLWPAAIRMLDETGSPLSRGSGHAESCHGKLSWPVAVGCPPQHTAGSRHGGSQRDRCTRAGGGGLGSQRPTGGLDRSPSAPVLRWGRRGRHAGSRWCAQRPVCAGIGGYPPASAAGHVWGAPPSHAAATPWSCAARHRRATLRRGIGWDRGARRLGPAPATRSSGSSMRRGSRRAPGTAARRRAPRPPGLSGHPAHPAPGSRAARPPLPCFPPQHGCF